jgi:flavin reductase (DIM6/NTAB) family NADH-FMN oxidoreductase RutF
MKEFQQSGNPSSAAYDASRRVDARMGCQTMKTYRKQDYPLIDIRRHLETGPIVLVTSNWKGKTNIMTMGWHMMLQFSPARFGCHIWDGNYSFEMIRNARNA